ncbi:MAG: alkaline shock response membrane anchor protein AmaP [Candidatus Omnitrophica bacterium]|nr:alkaline shock response membrane anchor protein AmaP [Candidatus Omnitrophota bacterium]
MMLFVKRLFILVFMCVMVATGTSFVLLSCGKISINLWNELFGIFTERVEGQAALYLAGSLLILMGVVLSFRLMTGMRADKFITLKNPGGEVIVSVYAVEEYIQKVAKNIPEISTIRSKVRLKRKGLKIVSDVVLRAGTRIPDVSEKIQSGVTRKVQGMLGLEGSIDLMIRVSKITGSLSPKDSRDGINSEEVPEIPYRY